MSGRVVVVGAGPAGLLAAGRAAELGARVVVLEKGPRTGRKLRISGKGRCNITNSADKASFIDAFGPNGKFLHGVFSRFFRDELLELLGEMGVETVVERGGRVFPASQKAGDVADAVERWALGKGAVIKMNATAREVEVVGRRVDAVKLYGGRMDAAAVVIATGGASYPRTGSTGDGYRIAEKLGHRIIPIRPALSALEVEEVWVKRLRGLSLVNVEASLIVPSLESSEKRVASEFGELVFTESGLSGPIILTLSRTAGALLWPVPGCTGTLLGSIGQGS